MAKRSNLWVMGLAALLLVGTVGWSAIKAHASPPGVWFETTAVATTTVAYLGNGTATSTYQFDNPNFTIPNKVNNMQAITAISFYVQVAASSTATTYTFTPQYSNNGIDWYNQGSEGTASTAGVVAVSTTTQFTWTPGTTATSSMVFNLPWIPTNHERMVMSASGAAGAVYAEVDLATLPNNP